MSTHTTIKRYLTIIRKLQKGPAAFQDLHFHLENESEICGYELSCSQRTLQRDIKDIEDLFGISIRNDRTRKLYFIEEEEAENDNNRLLESYEMLSALQTAGNYSPYVFFESRKPVGMENFYILLSAAKEHKELRFSYQKFYEDAAEIRLVHPYALKESGGRWYLIANDTKDNKIKTFGLDRITEPEIMHRKFQKANVPDIGNYFRDCFGIINPSNTLTEKVLLLFSADQGKYIHTYPLHHSQKITNIDATSKEMTFELQIKITYDFIMELLSFGEEIEVLAPKTLVKKMKEIYKNALGYYK